MSSMAERFDQSESRRRLWSRRRFWPWRRFWLRRAGRGVVAPSITLLIKELRQLMPLASWVIGLGIVGVIAVSNFAAPHNRVEMQSLFAVAMPFLIATGAGPVSISGEKESGTLARLGWLPYSPTRIVVLKFLAAALWSTLSVAVAWGVLATLPKSIFEPGWLIGMTALILSAGMLMSWMLENYLVALLMLVPMVVIPLGAVNVAADAMIDSDALFAWHISDSMLTIATAALVVPLYFASMIAVGVAVLGRGGASWWSGDRAGRSSRSNNAAATVAGGSSLSSTWLGSRVRGPSAALIAATWSGSLWGWAGVTVLMAALPALFVASIDQGWGVVCGWSAVIYFIIVCGLGVTVFTGDGASRRLRFMADRGVSPTMIWAARQSPALFVLGLSVLVFASVSWLIPNALQAEVSIDQWSADGIWSAEAAKFDSPRLDDAPDDRYRIMPSVLAVALATTFAYVVSLAVGMFVRPRLAAIIIGPGLAASSIGWIIVCLRNWIELGDPGLMVALVMGMSIVVWGLTACAMGWFADGRGGVAFWSIAAATAATVIVVPWTPIEILKPRRLTALPLGFADRSVESTEPANVQTRSSHRVIALPSPPDGARYDLEMDVATLIDRIAEFDRSVRLIDSAVDQMNGDQTNDDQMHFDRNRLGPRFWETVPPIEMDYAFRLPSELSTRLTEALESGDSNAAASRAFFDAADGFAVVVAGLRNRRTLSSNQVADSLERVLVETLAQYRDTLGLPDDAASAARRLVSNFNARKRWRTDALRNDYRRYQFRVRHQGGGDFAGYDPQELTPIRGYRAADHSIWADHLTAALATGLSEVRSPGDAASTAFNHRLATLFEPLEDPGGTLPAGLQTWPQMRPFGSLVGDWFGQWEAVGQSLSPSGGVESKVSRDTDDELSNPPGSGGA